jgi:hypothetical protein
MTPSLIYSDLVRPIINRILINLIIFDFIGSPMYPDESTIEYTSDVTIDNIASSVGNPAAWRYRLYRAIQVQIALRL